MLKGYKSNNPIVRDALKHASYSRRLLARPHLERNEFRRRLSIQLSEQGYSRVEIYFSARNEVKEIGDFRLIHSHRGLIGPSHDNVAYFDLICELLEFTAGYIDCVSPSWQLGAGGQGHIIFDVSTVPFQFKFKIDMNVTSIETIFEEETTP